MKEVGREIYLEAHAQRQKHAVAGCPEEEPGIDKTVTTQAPLADCQVDDVPYTERR